MFYRFSLVCVYCCNLTEFMSICQIHMCSFFQIDPIVRSLILALGVCYIASLEDRKRFCNHIIKYFSGPCALEKKVQTIEEQIET